MDQRKREMTNRKICFLPLPPPGSLEREASGEDASETQDWCNAHDLLQRLKFVAGNDDLIARNEVGAIGSFALINF